MRSLKIDVGSVNPELAVLRIKIVLLGTKPPIWRRVLVPAEFTLAQLHDVVQAAMGWEDCHLHQFYIGKQRFGVPDPNERFLGGSLTLNEKKTRLANLLNTVGAKATYIYDLGDSWEHALTVEKILPAELDVPNPHCTEGKLAAPPEDCGGIPGFYHMMEALADPNHEDHEDMRDWTDSFDPEAFSLEAVNKRMRKVFRAPRTSKSAGLAKRKATMTKPGTDDLQAAVQALQAAFEPFPDKSRQPIRPDQELPLELSDRERKLILEHAFADEALLGRLRVAPTPNQRAVFHFTLDDLEDLAGSVAAEANHAKDKKLRKEWDRIYARISDVLDSHVGLDGGHAKNGCTSLRTTGSAGRKRLATTHHLRAKPSIPKRRSDRSNSHPQQ
jgi:pRiA4b ORF-3-like protein